MKRILSLLSAFCPALMACALSPADATTDSVTEQAFVAFLDGIADMPQAQAVQAVDSVMQAAQARPGNFYNMAYWADAHLYEPASDRADERLYEPFARAVIASALTGLGEKAAAEWKLGAIALNAPGERPCDFSFRLADGTVARLGDIAGAEPVLLFFYDPDCHHCRVVMREIKDSIGGLKVLAVCVDSTQERWLETSGGLPQGWISAYDLTDVQAEDLYIIRALPAMYLLDGEGKVKLKTYNPKQLLNECATDC